METYKHDERFEWIIVAKDEDINDGIVILKEEDRERFLSEANPYKYNIVEELEKERKNHSKVVKQLRKALKEKPTTIIKIEDLTLKQWIKRRINKWRFQLWKK